MIDSYPAADSKEEIREWHEQGGGPVATALVALTRLGVDCRFFGVAGDDGAGDMIRHSLIAEGINADGLVTRTNASSQRAFIVIEKGTGRRTIFWKRSTGPDLRPEEVGADFLDGSAFLLLDGLMPDISLFAAKEARRRNIPVMVDAGRLRPGMIEIAQHCDYVVAAEQFALDLGGDGDPKSFREPAERLGARVVTITLGERGSVTYSNGDIIRTPAFAVEVADTTGAGDVFHGGYIFGILHGWEIRDTLKFASALAAMKCTSVGGRLGIPSLNQAMEFLAERGTHLSP